MLSTDFATFIVTNPVQTKSIRVNCDKVLDRAPTEHYSVNCIVSIPDTILVSVS